MDEQIFVGFSSRSFSDSFRFVSRELSLFPLISFLRDAMFIHFIFKVLEDQIFIFDFEAPKL